MANANKHRDPSQSARVGQRIAGAGIVRESEQTSGVRPASSMVAGVAQNPQSWL